MKLARTAALVVLAVVLHGCRATPAPPEALEAERQERDLRGAGASLLAAQEFGEYLRSLAEARRRVERENLKLGWLRDHGSARSELRAVLEAGAALDQKVRSLKDRKRATLAEAAATVRGKLETLDRITVSLAVRGQAREKLTRAGLRLKEGEQLIEREDFAGGSERLASADILIGEAERTLASVMARYLDPGQVRAWKRLVDETVAESKRKGVTVIVVSKLERELMIFKNGSLDRTYAVGLGFNGLADKRHAGDNATPEGRYSVIRKLPVSQYHKALLINYPNEDDRRSFAREKQRGTIPRSAAIGGQIEIHGGGRDGLTRGCVSLDDGDMDDLYERIPVGTAVTIVGTADADHEILKAIRRN